LLALVASLNRLLQFLLVAGSAKSPLISPGASAVQSGPGGSGMETSAPMRA
jgi:hypothetical protein